MKKSIVLILVCIQAIILSVMASSASGQTVNLPNNWNFISFQKLPSDGALIETVLADVLPKVRIVWGYDNTNKLWKKWKPQGGAGNTLNGFEFGKGYWIYMDNAGDIITSEWSAAPSSLSVPLVAGWNLVGHIGADDSPVTDILQPLAGKWNILWNWTNGQWYAKHATVTTLPVQPLTALNQGKAYWIKTTKSAEWNPSAAISGGTFGTGNFVVTVADNSIPPDVNATPVATADSAVPADIKVSNYETNVTSGAKAYTLKIGSAGFRTSTVGNVQLEVPFDRNLVPDQTKIDSLHMLLRILNADDNSVVTLTGQIVGDKIVADLTGFPSSATVTVLFNPNMDEVVSDPPVAGLRAPLEGETWVTRNWAVIYDTVEVAPEVQKFLALGSAPTPPQIRSALKQQIADHAADAAAIYQGEGFRSPTLYTAKTAAEPGGITYGTTPRYLIHYQTQKSDSFQAQDPGELVGPGGNHYGRIYIKDSTINYKREITGCTIYANIAHELFHAVQEGYDLTSWQKPGINTDGSPTVIVSSTNGVKEGTATAYGVILDQQHNGDPAAIPQVRQMSLFPTQIKDETFKLKNWLLTNATGASQAYSNQDFFVYLARTIGNNNYKYLANLFEQLRLTIADEANKQPNLAAIKRSLQFPAWKTIYKGFDTFLSGTYGTTLLKVYEDFVQQRAIEHNDASLFGRPGEAMSGLAEELFPLASCMKDVQIDPTSTNASTVNDLLPLDALSARVIRIRPVAGKAGGDITVSIAPTKGTFGTTLSGWIYRGSRIAKLYTSTPFQASNTITGFGADSSDELVIILINPSYVTDGVGINCEIKGTPTHFIDKGNGTIYDSVFNLTWLKNAQCNNLCGSWDNAMAKVNSLASGQCGLSDGSVAGAWRLPTRDEYQTFLDAGYYIISLTNAGFFGVDREYWSSTMNEYNTDADCAYTVHWGQYFVEDGAMRCYNRSVWNLAWPVRTGQ